MLNPATTRNLRVPFIPLGQYRARVAFRSYLTGGGRRTDRVLMEHREEEIANPTRHCLPEISTTAT
jgi:hypothetical protein